MAYTWK